VADLYISKVFFFVLMRIKSSNRKKMIRFSSSFSQQQSGQSTKQKACLDFNISSHSDSAYFYFFKGNYFFET